MFSNSTFEIRSSSSYPHGTLLGVNQLVSWLQDLNLLGGNTSVSVYTYCANFIVHNVTNSITIRLLTIED